MHSWHYQTGVGIGEVSVVGQLLDVSVVAPAELGIYFRIGNNSPIYVPPNGTFEIGAQELGRCCGAEKCDQYPGDQPITIAFGIAGPNGELSGEPVTWFVASEGCL